MAFLQSNLGTCTVRCYSCTQTTHATVTWHSACREIQCETASQCGRRLPRFVTRFGRPNPAVPRAVGGAPPGMKTDPQSVHDAQLRDFYLALSRAWGPQHWWPARSRLEVIAGAFLTQNTSWTNVERALGQLRHARLLSVDGIRQTSLARLEQLVRSAGYYSQKAQRLKNFVCYLDRRYGGSLARMFAQPTPRLRSELLELNGIGPETADSILLYAGGHEAFVVDTYTRRVLERHGLAQSNTPYDEIRLSFERALAAVATGNMGAAAN